MTPFLAAVLELEVSSAAVADVERLAAEHGADVEEVVPEGDLATVTLVQPDEDRAGDLRAAVERRGWVLCRALFDPAEVCAACDGATGRVPGDEREACGECGVRPLCPNCADCRHRYCDRERVPAHLSAALLWAGIDADVTF